MRATFGWKLEQLLHFNEPKTDRCCLHSGKGTSPLLFILGTVFATEDVWPLPAQRRQYPRPPREDSTHGRIPRWKWFVTGTPIALVPLVCCLWSKINMLPPPVQLLKCFDFLSLERCRHAQGNVGGTHSAFQCVMNLRIMVRPSQSHHTVVTANV